jgi:hypothetical protein
VGKAGQIPCQQGKTPSPPYHPIDNNSFLVNEWKPAQGIFSASQGIESAYPGILREIGQVE